MCPSVSKACERMARSARACAGFSQRYVASIACCVVARDAARRTPGQSSKPDVPPALLPVWRDLTGIPAVSSRRRRSRSRGRVLPGRSAARSTGSLGRYLDEHPRAPNDRVAAERTGGATGVSYAGRVDPAAWCEQLAHSADPEVIHERVSTRRPPNGWSRNLFLAGLPAPDTMLLFGDCGGRWGNEAEGEEARCGVFRVHDRRSVQRARNSPRRCTRSRSATPVVETHPSQRLRTTAIRATRAITTTEGTSVPADGCRRRCSPRRRRLLSSLAGSRALTSLLNGSRGS